MTLAYFDRIMSSFWKVFSVMGGRFYIASQQGFRDAEVSIGNQGIKNEAKR